MGGGGGPCHSLVIAACGGDDDPTAVPAPTAVKIGTVSVVHQWVSCGEPGGFSAVVQPWEALTGGEVDDLGTRDLLAILTTRVQGGDPPDIGVLAAPGTMQKFARDGELVALDSFLDMNTIRTEYSPAWIDLCTVDGKLYCLVWKASNKSTVWHNPKTFAALGIGTPTTWDELIAASNTLAGAGISPWSVGVESGGASGWPGTDWIGQLVPLEAKTDSLKPKMTPFEVKLDEIVDAVNNSKKKDNNDETETGTRVADPLLVVDLRHLYNGKAPESWAGSSVEVTVEDDDERPRERRARALSAQH